MYQSDFCIYPNNVKLLKGRKNVENRPITVYKTNFDHGEPTEETSIETRLETFNRSISKNRAKSCVPSERVTVASCLVWHRPNDASNNNQKFINEQTKTDTYNQKSETNKFLSNFSENITPLKNGPEF